MAKLNQLVMKKDVVAKLTRDLKALAKKQVLVGIPSANAARDDGGPLNNATIGYLMETGMPGSNVPARPFLVPGVQNSMREWSAYGRAAVKATLDGDDAKADQLLRRAGIVAETAVKKEITNNIPPPLAPSTIRGRKYARGTQSRRAGERDYLDFVAKGISATVAQSQAGIIALINTGELLHSITSVLRTKR